MAAAVCVLQSRRVIKRGEHFFHEKKRKEEHSRKACLLRWQLWLWQQDVASLKMALNHPPLDVGNRGSSDLHLPMFHKNHLK